MALLLLCSPLFRLCPRVLELRVLCVGQRVTVLDVLRHDHLFLSQEEDLVALRPLADAEDDATLRPLLQGVLVRVSRHAA